MKKYNSLVLAIVFSVGAIFVSGCSSQNTNANMNNSEEIAIEESGNKGEEITIEDPGNKSDDKDIKNDQFRRNNGGLEGDIAYTALTIEKEDLFSDRDLDSNPDISAATNIEVKDNSEYSITSEGIYILSGAASNFSVKVEAEENAKIQIVLNNAKIENDNFPIIYVKSADKCFVTALGENSISVVHEFVSDGDIKTDAAIFSKADLTLNGEGSLFIESKYGNGITTKDDLKITGGKYSISCALDGLEANDSISIYDGEFAIDTKKDAIHSENDNQQGSIYIKSGVYILTAGSDGVQATTYLVIDGGEFEITAAEGLEATYVQINNGTIDISASDDGINASRKSNLYDAVIEINGGDIKVSMGAGDTDGLDANGIIVVNGGNIDVTGTSTFDYDGGAIYNGGTIIVNGTVVYEIPESMMGGPGGFGGQRDKGDFGFPNDREEGDVPNDFPRDKDDFGSHRMFH